MNLLDILLLLPLVGFAGALLLPRDNHGLIRNYALVVSVLMFLVSLGLLGTVLSNPRQMSFETNLPWIESPAIRYHVGVDGLSVWLIVMSTFLMPICVLVSWKYIQKRVKEYYAFLVFLLFGMIGVFVALDLFLFFVFWEVSLVPMYFLIGIWGHDRRIYAALKFFLYTMAGSALMLVAIIWLYTKGNSFDIPVLMGLMRNGSIELSRSEGVWLFLAFFLAFAIKVPLFPLHTWLPDAHGEAPTAGSVMLASVLLKLGTYGIVRVCLPLFPDAARECAPWIVALSIAGIIYGALVAMVQPNMKRLVAYSSVSHLGFVVLGVFSFNQTALDGAVYQMLNHGISTGALFILVGMMYERRHSLEIADYGGVATAAPWLSSLFIFTALASAGLPLLNNFVGEFLILQGAAKTNFLYAVFAAIGVILSAVYLLWMVQRVFFGTTPEEVKHHMPDVTPREWAILLPLVALMLWMGVGTQSFLPPIRESSAAILESMGQPAVVAAQEVRHAR